MYLKNFCSAVSCLRCNVLVIEVAQKIGQYHFMVCGMYRLQKFLELPCYSNTGEVVFLVVCICNWARSRGKQLPLSLRHFIIIITFRIDLQRSVENTQQRTTALLCVVTVLPLYAG